MTIFDKREQGFEQEFAHDEELRFKIIARFCGPKSRFNSCCGCESRNKPTLK